MERRYNEIGAFDLTKSTLLKGRFAVKEASGGNAVSRARVK